MDRRNLAVCDVGVENEARARAGGRGWQTSVDCACACTERCVCCAWNDIGCGLWSLEGAFETFEEKSCVRSADTGRGSRSSAVERQGGGGQSGQIIDRSAEPAGASARVAQTEQRKNGTVRGTGFQRTLERHRAARGPAPPRLSALGACAMRHCEAFHRHFGTKHPGWLTVSHTR